MYFPQKGTINITGGSEAQAEMVKNFIKANDVKQPQAFVEVQIVELSEDGSKQFENSWTLLTPFSPVGLTVRMVCVRLIIRRCSLWAHHIALLHQQVRAAVKVVTPHKPSDITDTMVKRLLAWSINYIIESGKGRILANPKVMVTNGKKSLINLTSDYIKSTDEEIMTSGLGTGVAGVSRTYEIGEDNGISVELTPFISPDGYVTMNLKPEYATIQPNGEIHTMGNGGGDIIAATLLQRRNLDLSNIRIKDGETLVLGGLIQERESKNISKLPFLGDLPLIGSIFRSTTTSNEKVSL